MVDVTQEDDNAGGGDGLGDFANLLTNRQVEDATAGLLTYTPNTTEDEPEEGTGQGGLRVHVQEQEGTPENVDNTTDGAEQTLQDEVNVVASYIAGTLEGKLQRMAAGKPVKEVVEYFSKLMENRAPEAFSQ